MMREIKAIGVARTSTVLAVMYFVVGVISALVMLITPIEGMKGQQGMVLAMPIAYGFGGFVLTAILCLVYNAGAKLVGGIEIDLSGDQN